MARAARHLAAKTAFAGLLIWIWAGCANIEQPPGGPPDFDPPILVTVMPDSGTVVPDFRDDMDFQFDEIVLETSGGNLAQLFRVSPRHDEIRVNWRRSRITVRPRGGWYDSTVYQVTMLPGVTDLRSNRLTEGRTIVFSTGIPIPSTSIDGTVIDWVGGRIAPGGLIEAIRLPDSLTYVGTGDSVGDFTMVSIPPGRYVMVATLDENNNGRRDRREAFDSLTITLDSVFSRNFWTFPHDSVGPRISQVSRVDSMSIGVEFNQALSPVLPGPEAVTVRLLPDSTPVQVTRLLSRTTFDSLMAAVRDSISRDTSATDTVVQEEPPVVPDEPPPDTSRASQLLSERPPLTNRVVVTVEELLVPGSRYVVDAIVTNVFGATEESRGVLVLPAPRDST